VPKRQTIWTDVLHSGIVVSAGLSFDNLMGEFPETERRGAQYTLERLILCHDYSYAVHDSGEGSQFIDVGVGIVSQEAFDAGAIPDAGTTDDFPVRGWIYRCRHKLHGFASDQAATDVRTVFRDLRAKRRLDNGVPFIQFQNSPLSGAASSIQIVGITRALWSIG